MSLEEAAEYALDKEGIRAETADREATGLPQPVDNLSRREREVAVLVARGLTNRQISRALDLRAHRRQPRREDTPQAGPELADPDRHLGHRKRSARVGSRLGSRPFRASLQRAMFRTRIKMSRNTHA